MKNKLFKLIILLIIFVLVIFAAYYFIDKTNLIEKEKTAKLYFSTPDAMYLAAEERVIKGRNLYKAALNALIEGPTDSSLTKTIPEGVKVLNISKNNDTIHVDFSEEIETLAGHMDLTVPLGPNPNILQ